MGKSRLKSKDIGKLCANNKVRSLAIDILNRDFKHSSKPEKLSILKDVIEYPEKYKDHEYVSKIANEYLEKITPVSGTVYELALQPKPFKVFGKQHVSTDTVSQMETAIQLPVAVDGALMPDAHKGYGLPIGGVLAAENAVLPYGVGLDIGCRMSLSVYPDPSGFIKRHAYAIKEALKANTHFGIGDPKGLVAVEHEVLDRPEFNEQALLKKLHGKAARQLGTSGSGNHFVEFGHVQLAEANWLALPAGEYVGILAHSGSRGFGAEIANHFTALARKKCLLPRHAQNLAWLGLDSEAGQEYWTAMNLAGDYAKACHDVIHQKLAKALGLKPLCKIENHHNFAWKETFNGHELIVHRKGATPAHAGQMGVIPATMMHAGYIVSGLGNTESLCSASHGAGRKMSRNKAKSTITRSAMNKMLKAAGVELIGGNVDEAPLVYKNLDEVMVAQKQLVKVEGRFFPKIVRMDKA